MPALVPTATPAPTEPIAPAEPIRLAATIAGRIMLAPDILGGMLYFTTPCCDASGKGSANVESGVACRRCYADVGPLYGWAGLIYDDEGVVGQLTDLLTEVLDQGIPGPPSRGHIRQQFAAPMARRVIARAQTLAPRQG